ncbi:MAG: Amino acid permease [Labilithrix sp.]|nr:Amino acid permease [Labilithrix sp.]
MKRRSFAHLVLGAPLADAAEADERVGVVRGVGILGLDALASASYGPEALLTTLIVVGSAGAAWVVPLAGATVLVLLLVALSYRQTIAAYPNGGGAFQVAKENLGRRAGLLAAAALSLDYVLNVSVAIAAGVGALVSVIPSLLPHTVSLCLGVLVLLTLVSLRGVRNAGTVFVLPTVLFVGTLLATLGMGLFGTASAGAAAPLVPAASKAVDVWLLARAFANGCSALTGVEAVSNAVPIFQEPRVPTARRTLIVISVLLAVLLLGIAFLARAQGIVASPPGEPGYESVISRLVAAVVGRGWFYRVTLASVIGVLALSANTSFADFPRLCRLLAGEGFLPAFFAQRGRRLVFSAGILTLAVLAGILLLVFHGVTDNLIPLFAVGALASFTLSQAGMVVHWRRNPGPGSSRSLVLNAVGATATGLTLLVVVVAKIAEGAWISILIVAGLVLLFARIRRHYDHVDRSTALEGPLDLRPLPKLQVVLPIRRWDRASQQALRFAVTLSQDVEVVQVHRRGPREDLAETWGERVEEPARRAGTPVPKLVVLESTRRELLRPLVQHVRHMEGRDRTRFIVVVLPRIVEARWYHVLLHANTAAVLSLLLLLKGGPRVLVVSCPWYVSEGG